MGAMRKGKRIFTIKELRLNRKIVIFDSWPKDSAKNARAFSC